MIRIRSAMLLMAMTSLAACGRLGFGETSSYDPPPAQPARPLPAETLQPLPPAPPPQGAMLAPAQPGTVQGQPLPPPGAAAPGQVAMAPAGAPVPVSADKALPISKGAMSGGWVLTSGIDNCQLFLTQSAWAGGSRANTKGCTSPELMKISAWTIDGKQITLKGTDGSLVASLYSSAPEQFSGQTASRQPISLGR